MKKEAKNFGEWHVTESGDMIHTDYKYKIDGYRLVSKIDDNNEWILHMMDKKWVDMNDFIPAYFHALKNLDTQYVEIKTHY